MKQPSGPKKARNLDWYSTYLKDFHRKSAWNEDLQTKCWQEAEEIFRKEKQRQKKS